MGVHISKIKSKLKKNERIPIELLQRRVTDIKHDVEEQMNGYCHVFEPQVAPNGVSYFATVDSQDYQKKLNASRPKLTSEEKGDPLNDAFTAKERYIMATILREENKRKKAHPAQEYAAKRQMLLQRRARRVEEQREKLEEKMKRNEERKNEMLARFRPAKPRRVFGQSRSMFTLPMPDQVRAVGTGLQGQRFGMPAATSSLSTLASTNAMDGSF